MKVASEIVRDLCLMAVCAAWVWALALIAPPVAQMAREGVGFVQHADLLVQHTDKTMGAVAPDAQRLVQHSLAVVDNVAATAGDLHTVTEKLATESADPKKKKTTLGDKIIRLVF